MGSNLRAAPIIDWADLRRCIHYEPETGIFRWVGSPPPRQNQTANIAGALQKSNGYWKISFKGHAYLAHRLAWFWMTGEWPPFQIDHRDMNRSNNKWSNIRLATQVQNQGNRGVASSNKLGLKGVSLVKDKRRQKWRARMTINGKPVMLGRFNCPAAAHFAYLLAAAKRYGEFARAR